MIIAKIIKDSVTHHGKRLTTFELEYPRFIHAELMTHRALSKNSASCLSGDTVIYIEKPCALKKGRKSIQPMTIKDIVNKWFDGDSNGRKTQSRLKEMKLRCLNEDTGEFQTTSITNCFKSGVKDVFEIQLENGYSLKCTKEHRIFTKDGWKTLEDFNLNISSSGIVNWNADASEFATNGIELDFEEIFQLQEKGLSRKQIAEKFNISVKFLENHVDLKKTCLEINKPKSKGNPLVTRFSKIKSIKFLGKQETYDLEVAGPYHNFVANGIVVHNSRAIPIKTMLSLVWNNMAMPIHWGKQQAGMQAKYQLGGWRLALSKFLWVASGKVACIFAYLMYKCGLAKQVVNRIVEPWSHIKIVLSGTDFDNFFHLRNHPDAQPEIHQLAKLMWSLYQENKPDTLVMGEWHLPYIEHDHFGPDGQILYFIYVPSGTPKKNKAYLDFESARQLSASLCAQVSYRKADISLEKAINIYHRLVSSKPVHASPFEHQATPLENATDRSGNFSGWAQFRALIPDNVCYKYEEINHE